MSDHTTWVAFRPSETLHQTTDSFINRMRGGASRPEPETIEKIMSTFMQEVLHNFFIVPTEQAGLPSSTQKVVQFTVDTINKATHLVIKSTVRKLDIDQNRRAADYMDTVRFKLESNGEDIWFVAFPLNEMMAAKGRKAFEQGINGQGKQALPALLEYFHQLTDIALYWYFEEPMKLLRFGPIDPASAALRPASGCPFLPTPGPESVAGQPSQTGWTVRDDVSAAVSKGASLGVAAL